MPEKKQKAYIDTPLSDNQKNMQTILRGYFRYNMEETALNNAAHKLC